jgi:ribose-phosphate pyrophosphokinase
MQLLLATDALRRAGFRKISAWLPYFPAARQDRIMMPGEPLSVKVYAQIINAQGYERVMVFDPHSDVTPALLDRAEVTTSLPFVQKVLQLLDHQENP